MNHPRAASNQRGAQFSCGAGMLDKKKCSGDWIAEL
jgi:hypothetical protein